MGDAVAHFFSLNSMELFGRKRNLFIAIAGIALIVGAYLFFTRDSDAIKQLKRLEAHPRSVRAYEESAVEKIRYELTESGNKRIVGELTFEQKLALIREKWGKHIQRPYIQIKMLEDLINLCQKEQPNDWVACVNELAAAAFPQLAGKLFNQLSSLVKYNDWLTRNKERLDKMTRQDRQKLLAEMRNGLFGEENAKDIWAAEAKAESIRTALDQLKEAKGKDINAKLGYFKDVLRENYGDQAKAYIERHQQELTNAIVDSVQADLRGMSPTQQRYALRSIRSEMGMDNAALERWDNLDHEREQRWNAGKAYNSERDQILKSGQSNSAEQIAELRKKYFGAEADSIAVEEAEGHYRYQGTQRIGLE